MPIITIVFGVFLILLGIVGYVATGGVSVTALIPAFFGVPLVVLGVLARNERFLKHAMHGAAVLGVLAVAGTARGLPGFFRFLGGGEVERPPAVIAQAVMFVASLLFVILCVRSFVLARRSKEGGSA